LISTPQLKQATAARAGWDPSDWSIDQAARIYLLLAAASDGATFLRRLDQLCNTASIGPRPEVGKRKTQANQRVSARGNAREKAI